MLRIGLVSDTHIPEARPNLWPQVFEAFRQVDLILHAGDIHDLAVIDALGELAPIYVARGNGDDGDGARPVQPHDHRLRRNWSDLGGHRIGLVHAVPLPERPPHLTLRRFLEREFAGAALDLLVYGDTHVESIETVGGLLCVNPGSPTLPHNLTTRLGTIGFLEIANGAPSANIWQLTDDGSRPFDWPQR